MKNEIMAKALTKNATFSHIEWERPCKVRKGTTDIITKSVVATNVRIGASYDNLQAVKIARANGDLPQENQGLKGKKWIVYPTILQSLTTNKLYIRVEKSANSKMKSQYYRNGKAVDKSEIEQFLLANEKSSGNPQPIFDLPLENITVLN